MGKTVLIAGASGFVGTAATERFVAEGARVIGLARHRPERPVEGAEYLPVDLRDPGSCAALAEKVGEATHLVYAAVNETPGDLIAAWTDPDHAGRNGMMLDNLLGIIEASAPNLRHVTLVHGTKAYATHRPDRPIPVPLREDMPRPDNDDFYFRQEDRLWAGVATHGYGWTVLRAPIISGGGRGSNLNNLLAIAVFASLRRDAGLDRPFPGTWPSLGVTEMVDVELLARAIEWAGEAESARDQIFNVANGDAFAWADLWPVIAEEIGLPIGLPTPMSVRAYVDGEVERWAAMVRRHGLSVDEGLAFLGESASLVDFAVNNTNRPILTSTIKIRQAGFHDCVDTADSVVGWLRRWRAERLIPPR
jgi:nucleoside-diphosphate-sugar epimerase